ncbi:4'-phosphopantetheinyl transferase superfamily protein [Actinocorallia sp. API 0066]|uniref:4'-phosphopantetheinyl transferase family protein n=1 Tax=Actinocorallia sp. API 0066 TaxID=2896846 RepID=UPI001E51A5AE|nr:4'-phosphopantetheinyl transferase superfamily protein [Actinocorallia sp. API 0066]MCD0452143.1 4'-phosphopantetheinyl transferase superfamily protein [Actinocorallia sp. API 0066]
MSRLADRQLRDALTVSPGRLDLWVMRGSDPHGPGPSPALLELSEAERARAARFLGPSGRLRFTSAHVLLRRVVAAYLGEPPDRVRFVREACPGCGGPHGRPAVAGAPLQFSMSHSRDLVLIGVAAATVGVDVERVPRAESVAACGRMLHPAEQSELAALDVEERRRAFGRLWTRKEAYLKALGTGLSRDLGADFLGAETPGGPRRPPGWTVVDVDVAETHAAAAVVRGTGPLTTTLRGLPDDAVRVADPAPLLGEAVFGPPRQAKHDP